jgi:Pvc16 N-terminal domain/IPT/TIG domain
LSALDLEELSRVWGTFSHPFRLSVMYEVSVVELELLGEQPMSKRVQQVGVPDVQAPFHPPIVDQLTPLRGPVGTTITIQGQHLAGWQASITMMRKRIVDGAKLTTDVITANIPAGLPPGIHQLRVDVANLHRRVFFFEVTTS